MLYLGPIMFKVLDLITAGGLRVGLNVSTFFLILLLLIRYTKRRESRLSTVQRTADVPDVFRNLPDWVTLEASW